MTIQELHADALRRTRDLMGTAERADALSDKAYSKGEAGLKLVCSRLAKLQVELSRELSQLSQDVEKL